MLQTKQFEMDTTNKMPHLGRLLDEKLKAAKLTRDDVGKRIGKKGVTVYGYLEEPSLHARILWELSKALNFDFFEYLSQCLHQGASATDKLNDATTQITQLQNRIADLEKELAIYKEIVLKR